MIIVTTPEVPGAEIERPLGIARGATIGAGDVAKGSTGIDPEASTRLLAESREKALAQLTQHAKSLGADAVVSTRITTSIAIRSPLAHLFYEVLAYGTAVKLK